VEIVALIAEPPRSCGERSRCWKARARQSVRAPRAGLLAERRRRCASRTRCAVPSRRRAADRQRRRDRTRSRDPVQSPAARPATGLPMSECELGPVAGRFPRHGRWWLTKPRPRGDDREPRRARRGFFSRVAFGWMWRLDGICVDDQFIAVRAVRAHQKPRSSQAALEALDVSAQPALGNSGRCRELRERNDPSVPLVQRRE
jgi:hypothetical protein